MNKCEIISVAVITYNSSATVIETLNSILNQTYGSNNIELIISDDASTDDTIQVVRSWVSQNNSNFYNVSISEATENGGISKNCNNALKQSNANWVKLIAGDDLLEPKCLKLYSEFITSETSVVLAKQKYFGSNNKKIGPRREIMSFFDLNASKQYEYLLKNTPFLPGPTIFLNKSAVDSVGGFIEKYRLIDDYPLFLNLTKNGFKIDFLHEVTVRYRSAESITQSNEKLVNYNSLACRMCVYEDMVYSDLFRINPFLVMLRRYEFFVLENISSFFANKKNKLSIAVLRFFLIHKVLYSIYAKLKFGTK